jgi:hypothetical protein
MKDSWPNQALDLLIAPEFVALEDGPVVSTLRHSSFQWKKLESSSFEDQLQLCIIYAVVARRRKGSKEDRCDFTEDVSFTAYGHLEISLVGCVTKGLLSGTSIGDLAERLKDRFQVGLRLVLEQYDPQRPKLSPERRRS